MKILLFETGAEPSLEELLSPLFSLTTTTDSDEVVSLLKRYDYDLVVFDVGLNIDLRLELITQLRRGKVGTPVIVVSNDSNPQKKVDVLDMGADDYLARPFYKPELAARIRAVVRRAHGQSSSTLSYGDLTVRLDKKTIEINGKEVRFDPKEYRALELFLLRPSVTIVQNTFLEHVYYNCDEPENCTMRQFICRLRRKLRRVGSALSFETVWAVGYRLSTPEEVRQRLKVAA
ncbi:MAG: response regulator transcription factor [Patescibacteria group bacterium]